MNKFTRFIFYSISMLILIVITLSPAILSVIYNNPWLVFLYFVVWIPFIWALMIIDAIEKVIL